MLGHSSTVPVTPHCKIIAEVSNVTELLDANKLASFVVDDINGLWKLWGIHPRWGPSMGMP